MPRKVQGHLECQSPEQFLPEPRFLPSCKARGGRGLGGPIFSNRTVPGGLRNARRGPQLSSITCAGRSGGGGARRRRGRHGRTARAGGGGGGGQGAVGRADPAPYRQSARRAAAATEPGTWRRRRAASGPGARPSRPRRRVVGSELVDTYTVCWGPGLPHWEVATGTWSLESGAGGCGLLGPQLRGRCRGAATLRRGPGMAESGERALGLRGSGKRVLGVGRREGA